MSLVDACSDCDAERVAALLKDFPQVREAVNAVEPEGVVSALTIACYRGDVKIVEMLMRAVAPECDPGTSLNSMSQTPYTPLQTAVMWERPLVVKALAALCAELELDLDIDSIDNGYTILMYASRHGYTECVEELINAGADVSLRGDGVALHRTALEFACEHAHVDCVKLLLSALDKCPPKVLSEHVEAALSSTRGGCTEITELLERQGGAGSRTKSAAKRVVLT
jgi:ankyrin repeat protein